MNLETFLLGDFKVLKLYKLLIFFSILLKSKLSNIKAGKEYFKVRS